MNEDSGKKKSNNFGLTKTEFLSLMESLRAGNEVLFEKIFVSQAHKSIEILQRKMGQSFEDSYDATMETLLNFRKCLIEGRLEYGNLKYIFNRMAKFFVLKKIERNKEFSTGEIILFEISNTESKYKLEEIEKMSKIWKTLEEEEKKILHLHFNLGARLNDIAQNLGITEPALRKRKQRILDKIKNHF